MKKIFSLLSLILLLAFLVGCQEGMEKKEMAGELDRTVLSSSPEVSLTSVPSWQPKKKVTNTERNTKLNNFFIEITP